MNDWSEMTGDDGGVAPAKETQAQVLCQLAAPLELWRTPGGDLYATVPASGHCEHWPVRSRALRLWLTEQFFARFARPPAAQALSDALGVLEARAQFAGNVRDIYIRVSGSAESVYIDIGGEELDSVYIQPGRWSVLADPPVRFRRARGMLALPYPERGGSIDELRELAGLEDADTWYLVLSWLTMAMRPTGPYPVLSLSGEQGSGKSSLARLLRSLIDPSSAPLRAEPREGRDLAIASRNAWVLALDNLSRVQPWLSDGLCRIATGGGYSTRELYSDADELIIDAMRPVVLTGIAQLGSRGDLLERSLLIELPSIPESLRLAEREYHERIDAARPRMLGALLDLVAQALAELPGVRLERLPRMADFANWGAAVERAAGWPSGSFAGAYARTRQRGSDLALEDPVAEALVPWAHEAGDWRGTAGELLRALEPRTEERIRRGREWPQNARGLSSRLARLAPDLRRRGIHVERGTRTDRARLWRVCRTDESPAGPSGPSGPSARSPARDTTSTYDMTVGEAGHDGWDGDGGTVRRPSGDRQATVRAQDHTGMHLRGVHDGHDDHDGRAPAPSISERLDAVPGEELEL